VEGIDALLELRPKPALAGVVRDDTGVKLSVLRRRLPERDRNGHLVSVPVADRQLDSVGIEPSLAGFETPLERLSLGLFGPVRNDTV